MATTQELISQAEALLTQATALLDAASTQSTVPVKPKQVLIDDSEYPVLRVTLVF